MSAAIVLFVHLLLFHLIFNSFCSIAPFTLIFWASVSTQCNAHRVSDVLDDRHQFFRCAACISSLHTLAANLSKKLRAISLFQIERACNRILLYFVSLRCIFQHHFSHSLSTILWALGTRSGYTNVATQFESIRFGAHLFLYRMRTKLVLRKDLLVANNAYDVLLDMEDHRWLSSADVDRRSAILSRSITCRPLEHSTRRSSTLNGPASID